MIQKRSRFDYVLSTIAGLIVLALVIPASDDIESYMFPVAREVASKAVSRTHDQACWQFTFVKKRDALPWHFSWEMVGSNTGDRTNVWVFDPVTMRTETRGETARPAYGLITQSRCAIIPFHMRRDQKLWVDAHASYDVWHGLWRLTRNVGPIEINIPPPGDVK